MKRGTRIYLDVCCLNRPFDNQEQQRVRMEAEAIKSILLLMGAGRCVAIGSDAIDFEIDRLADPDRYLELMAISDDFAEHVRVGEAERRRGNELEALGLGPMDALHVACAEKAGADVVLTTDDALVKRARRCADLLTVRVVNPLVWLGEVLGK
ncbi:MAG: hypothetical protein ACI9OU_001683 [Candidatus Promineifilaceae bacterium]|jgi:hypothetical protein